MRKMSTRISCALMIDGGCAVPRDLARVKLEQHDEGEIRARESPHGRRDPSNRQSGSAQQQSTVQRSIEHQQSSKRERLSSFIYREEVL
jgi:hypothetical protein